MLKINCVDHYQKDGQYYVRLQVDEQKPGGTIAIQKLVILVGAAPGHQVLLDGFVRLVNNHVKKINEKHELEQE